MSLLFAIMAPPVIYTPPERCAWLEEGEWDACKAPESWNDFCWSMTSYWPFDDDGDIVAGNNQTDEDPTSTAVGVQITSVEQDGMWVALPLPLITDGYYTYVCFYGWGCLPGWDTFGDLTYQAGGFWHEGYERKVIGVDIFTAEPLHYLLCNDDENQSRIRLDIYRDGNLTNPKED